MLLAVMVAAACGRDSETSTGDTSTSDGQSATTAAGSGGGSPLDEGAFGDLGVVCAPAAKGKANADGSDPGVTADSIQIGTFADPGFQGSLGLDQELFDTAEAFTKWCNDHGGINGRKIDLKERDAAVLQFQQRVIEACDQGDFFVVGGGAVFDDTGQSDRLACGLPAIPGFTVTPAASESDLQVQPVPIRNDQLPFGQFRYLFKKFPDTKNAIGVFGASVQTVATVAKRNKEALLANGAKIVYEGTYNAERRDELAALPRSDAQRGREGSLLGGRAGEVVVAARRGREPRHLVRLGRDRPEQLRPEPAHGRVPRRTACTCAPRSTRSSTPPRRSRTRRRSSTSTS